MFTSFCRESLKMYKRPGGMWSREQRSSCSRGPHGTPEALFLMHLDVSIRVKGLDFPAQKPFLKVVALPEGAEFLKSLPRRFGPKECKISVDQVGAGGQQGPHHAESFPAGKLQGQACGTASHPEKEVRIEGTA